MSQPARLHDLVQTSRAVRGARGRIEKRQLLAQLFARLDQADLALAASYLAGEIPQGRVQVGWAALNKAGQRSAPDASPALFRPEPERPLESPELTALDATFERLRTTVGAGSAARRQIILDRLLAGCEPEERAFLVRLVLGELRQGALRALVLEALAETFHVEVEALRRAAMFSGSFVEVSDALARDGEASLGSFGPRALVPIEPMLAAQGTTLEELFAGGKAAGVEWKLDGVRIQVHRAGDAVKVFSRKLRDVTDLVPQACDVVRNLRVQSIILDGEMMGWNAQQRPIPFQELMSWFSTREEGSGRKPSVPDLFGRIDVAQEPGSVRLAPLFFDILAWNGESLVNQPYSQRARVLERLLPVENRVRRLLVSTPQAARQEYDSALQAGHEGVIVKALDSPYIAGRRGAAWCKIKASMTLDLVILAAEWGHGRREGVLSNIHLGARAPETATGFVMLGKTFKGLTDDMLRDMTAELLHLETAREGAVVHVEPTCVVEVAFDAVQRSPRYDSGLVLRFARIKRFRPDKSVQEASTLDEIRYVFESKR